MNRHTARIFTTILASAITLGADASQPDTAITYQGSLSDANAPASGSYPMRFSLWDSLAGGNQLGSTVIVASQTVTDGLFATELDFGADAFDDSDCWLEIVVSGTTLAPRQAITRAPFAIQTRGLFVDENKNVGIGTSSPAQQLDVRADNFTAVQAISSGNSNGIGVYGRASSNTGITYGLYGLADSPGGTGVSGRADSATGTTYGVFGRADSPDGYAGYFHGRGYFRDYVGFNEFDPAYPVHAKNSSGTAIYGDGQTGVYGASTSTNGRGLFGFGASLTGTNFGVYGLTASSTGRALYGSATHADGKNYGVYGRAAGNTARGVFGYATSTTGLNYGAYGRSESSSGRGVYGYASNAGGVTYGVYGRSNSTDGYGVAGLNAASTAGFGLYGEASGIRATGVYGEATGIAGVGVSGKASATTNIGIGVFGSCISPSGYAFFADTPGTNYGSSSSRRWKSNIVPIDDPIGKLAQIRGVYYDWDEAHGGQHDVGMIAEEVGAVLPEIVQYEENGIDAHGMDYSKITPLLVEAVNALRAEHDAAITALSANDDALRAENASLRARLESLESFVERLASAQQKEDSR